MCTCCRGPPSPGWAAPTGPASPGDSSAATTPSSRSTPTSPTILPRCRPWWRRSSEGFDVVIGSRYIEGGSIPNWAWHRHLLSRGGNIYASGVLGLGVADSTAGYRAYSAGILRQLDLDRIRAEGYGFQIEMTYRARQHGARHHRSADQLRRPRAAGESKMSSFIVVEALGPGDLVGPGPGRATALRLHSGSRVQAPASGAVARCRRHAARPRDRRRRPVPPRAPRTRSGQHDRGPAVRRDGRGTPGPHPRRRRRAEHRRAALGRAHLRGLPGRRRRHGRRGARAGAQLPPASRHARRHAARLRRQRGLPAAAQPGRADADRLPHGARHDPGQGRGPEHGRRLRDEALQHRGADGPGRGHPAPGRRDGGGRHLASCSSPTSR